jgi:hypothetical protein
MKHLNKWGLATFKPTTRGTIATLCDTRIYDINEAGAVKPATNDRQTRDKQATTNKNEKKEKKDKKRIHADAWRLGALLLNLILEGKPDFRKPSLESWAGDIDRMIRLDGRSVERIEAVIRWCRRDPFWSSNILSAAKLRKHFDRLELEMARHRPKETTDEQVARLEREGWL